MDYKNYKLYRVGEIQCIEEDPANMSLSENITNKLSNSNFLNFKFINNKQPKKNDNNENFN